MKKTVTYTFPTIKNELGVAKAEVEISLKETKRGPAFSSSAFTYGKYGRELFGGQCHDELEGLIEDPKFNRILAIWREYHLNDMQAGTKTQMEYLKKVRGNNSNYEVDCALLKEANLYDINGDRYGASWYYKEIPESVLKEIEQLISEGE